jgi:hypothetical protein
MIIDFCLTTNTDLGLITHTNLHEYWEPMSKLNIMTANSSINTDFINYYPYYFNESLITKLDKTDKNKNIKYLIIPFLDRSIYNYKLLETKIKNKYPNVLEIYFMQNYGHKLKNNTCNHSFHLTTLESFFVNMGLNRLRVDDYQSELNILFNNPSIIQIELDKIYNIKFNYNIPVYFYEFTVGLLDTNYNINIKISKEWHYSCHKAREIKLEPSSL